jgi:hypothetical protein
MGTANQLHMCLQAVFDRMSVSNLRLRPSFRNSPMDAVRQPLEPGKLAGFNSGIADSLVHARLTGYAIQLRLRAYAIAPKAFEVTQHMCTAGFAITIIEMQSTTSKVSDRCSVRPLHGVKCYSAAWPRSRLESGSSRPDFSIRQGMSNELKLSYLLEDFLNMSTKAHANDEAYSSDLICDYE